MMWWGMGPQSADGAWNWTWAMGSVFGLFMMVAFWGAIVLLVVWGIRALNTPRSPAAPTGATPVEIAQRRYAAGEITREQYEQIKKDLSA